jgi:peptide/nickel transport system permease protein
VFTALTGHNGLFSSIKKKNHGKLFTPSVVISIIILIMILAGSIFAPLFATHDPYKNDLTSSLAGPSQAHWFGCDKNGRDIYSRVLYGGRTAILGALGVVGLSIIMGIPLGLICGYFGGFVDSMIMRVCDIILAFPTLLLAFIFVAAFGRGLTLSVIALGIVYVPMLTRLTRSCAIVEKNKVYISACVSLGYSPLRIMFVHILPNCISTIVVQLTLDLGYAILDLSSLSFLGLGVLEPTADWGAMLGEGRQYLLANPYLSLAPGMVIVMVVVALNLFSDGLHQYLDNAQVELPSFKSYERKLLKEKKAKGGH